MIKRIVTIILGVMVMVSPGFASDTPSISLRGEARQSVVPDELVINLSLEHRGMDIAELKKAHASAVDQLITTTQAFQSDPRKIKTGVFHIEPQYKRDRMISKFDGYRATTTLTVVFESEQNYSGYLSRIVEEENRLSIRIHYQVSRMERVMLALQKDALLDAKQKAKIYAKTLGHQVGDVIEIKIMPSSTPMPMHTLAANRGIMEQTYRFMPGEVWLTASAEVKFEIK